MKSIREIYKIGKGPSSSHTMGPERAALLFQQRYPQATFFQVTLYGSLSKTGVGHGTDRVLKDTLGEDRTKIVFSQEAWEGMHPNTMDFSAFADDLEIGHLRIESIGGGDIRIPGQRASAQGEEVYIEHSFAEIVKALPDSIVLGVPLATTLFSALSSLMETGTVSAVNLKRMRSVASEPSRRLVTK